MKKHITITLLCLLLLTQLATASEIYQKEFLELDINVSSSFTLQKQSNSAVLESVEARLFFNPKEPGTEILKLMPIPNAKTEDDSLIFEWANFEDEYEYSANAHLRSWRKQPRVTRKIEFPLIEVPAELEVYLRETEYFDYSDAGVKDIANRIAAGKNDLFQVVSEIGIWVQDYVSYNLSTLTERASRPSSWVLKNRIGVCDELTNLFISMNRALGIPVRFVSGIAYSEEPSLKSRWGAHGWAEVWFPDAGWVPFDPTFGQFGWIDASHIKTRVQEDAVSPAVTFHWTGFDIGLDPEEISISGKILREGPLAEPTIDWRASFVEQTAGPYSWNGLSVSLKNLAPYYQVVSVGAGNVEGLERTGPQNHHIILQPKRVEIAGWLYRIITPLEQGYEYVFPVIVRADGKESKTSFSASNDAKTHTKSVILGKEKGLFEDSLKERFGEQGYWEIGLPEETRKSFDLQCSNVAVLEGQKGMASCEVINRGNVPVSGTVCISAECRPFDVYITETQTVELGVLGPGYAVAKSEGIEVKKKIGYTVEKEVTISISVSTPEKIDYGESAPLRVDVETISRAVPKNGTVHMEIGRLFYKEKLMQPMSREYIISADGLAPGINNGKIAVIYSDELDRVRTETREFSITARNVPWWKRIIFWLSNL